MQAVREKATVIKSSLARWSGVMFCASGERDANEMRTPCCMATGRDVDLRFLCSRGIREAGEWRWIGERSRCGCCRRSQFEEE